MLEKRAGVVVFDEVDLTQENFDRPIYWVFALLLAFLPAALGAYEAWSEFFGLLGASALAIMLGIKLARRPDVRFVWSWTYLPIALFFLVIALQLIPLPAAIAQAISPRTVQTNRALLSDLPDAARRLANIHLSFYPEGTWHDFRNLLALACVFVVVINVFRTADQLISLLWIVAWVGAAEGLLAILQISTGARGVYWLIPQWGSRPDGGTFPNHNVFSQFMNLSSGAILGLLLLQFDRTFHRRDYEPSEIFEKLRSSDFRWAYPLAAMLAISVSAVFLSLSRGGMISIAVAGVITGILLAVRGGSRGMGAGGWVAGVVLVVAMSLIMVGGANLVEARIAHIGNPDDRFDRIQLTKDTFRAWKDYPLLGMGVGTFKFTFPPYDRSNVAAIASHAEDDYVELLQESGVVGASIAALFLLMILGCFLRARSRNHKHQHTSEEPAEADSLESAELLVPRFGKAAESSSDSAASLAAESEADPSHRHGRHRHGRRKRKKHTASPASSLSIGLCFGLVAILVQSALDFGQQFLSVACLTAVTCAIFVNVANIRRGEQGLIPRHVGTRGNPVIRWAALVVLLGVFIPVLWQSYLVRAATAEFDTEQSLGETLGENNWQGEVGDIADLNNAADRAVAIRPTDIRFHFMRAMNRYHSITADAPVDPVTQDFVLTPAKLRVLREMVDDLQAARWLCPLHAEILLQTGQWDRYQLGEPEAGARLIRMAADLGPGDFMVSLVTGTLDGEEGKWADSVRHFQRAVLLKKDEVNEVVNLYVGYFHRPDIGLQFADGSINSLRLLAQQLRALGKDQSAGPTTGPATRSSDEAIALQADRRADALVRAAADQKDAPPEILGEMGLLCVRQKDWEQAVSYLGRAELKAPDQMDWRLALARSLLEVGRTEEAVSEAQSILRHRPQWEPAQELIDRATHPAGQRPLDTDELHSHDTAPAEPFINPAFR